MADEPTSTSQSPPRTRRSSFAGATFADLFGTARSSVSAPRNVPSTTNGDSQQGQYPGPITNAAAQAQRRRMSLTTLGLSGSPTATSPFGSYRGRGESIGSANSGSIDESAVEDDFAKDQTTPTTPFARRMSFGARAMRDIRSGGSGGGGGVDGSPPQNGRSIPPPAPSSQHARQASTSVPSTGTISARDGKGRGLSSLPSHHSPLSASSSSSRSHTSFSIPFSNRRLTIASATGEGFNWSENLRSRAERTSIAGPSGGGGVGLPLGSQGHSRAKSIATMEPPREMPPQPRAAKKPDHFQERILKGDFYMD
jgi:hypothetical protein